MDVDESRIRCVAIMSPGDMGHAIGRVLVEAGFRVISHLEGRSERTRRLARQANIEAVDRLHDVAQQADLILSILVPSQAETAAAALAHAIQVTGTRPLFADCNAVSPECVRRIGQTIEQAGGRFVDAAIIGLPPGTATAPRLYVAGPNSVHLACLQCPQFEVVQMPGPVGQASGIKMCYAALTKGTFALQFAVLMAAGKLGLYDTLCGELNHSQTGSYAQMLKQLPRLPAKAFRWVGEMEYIAETMRDAGVPPEFHQAAADIFRSISQSPLGQEAPETIDTDRSLDATIASLINDLHGPP